MTQMRTVWYGGEERLHMELAGWAVYKVHADGYCSMVRNG